MQVPGLQAMGAGGLGNSQGREARLSEDEEEWVRNELQYGLQTGLPVSSREQLLTWYQAYVRPGRLAQSPGPIPLACTPPHCGVGTTHAPATETPCMAWEHSTVRTSLTSSCPNRGPPEPSDVCKPCEIRCIAPAPALVDSLLLSDVWVPTRSPSGCFKVSERWSRLSAIAPHHTLSSHDWWRGCGAVT